MAAVGMVEVEGVAGIVLAADAACKTADVDLIGWTSIGGVTTIFFSGSIGAVNNALRAAEQAAKAVSPDVNAAAMTQPEPAYEGYVTYRTQTDAAVPAGALGLLEMRGYGFHVRTNDAMVKAADVRVFNVLTVMDRVVCSLIMGDVAAVKEALAVGRALAEGYPHFMGTALIAQPFPEVLRAFGPQGGGI